MSAIFGRYQLDERPVSPADLSPMQKAMAYWGPDGDGVWCEGHVGMGHMLRHNTPGKRDGEQAFWIDGELRGHWKGIGWRTSKTLWANAFTLEAYVTDRWTKQRVNKVCFDNVVIATEYIGPSVPLEPTSEKK